MKPTLICLCGLQGSGKSTYANGLVDIKIVSSDAIRKEFPDAKNDTIFQIVYRRINEYLKQGFNVCLDATNTTIKARKQIFLNIKEPCIKECIIFNTPYEECIERVKERNKDENSHYVPLEVVDKYYKSFEIPFYEEGWDVITLYRYIETSSTISYLDTQLLLAKGFDQQNKHHTQDLGLHLQSTYEKAKELTNDPYVIEAAKYHDVGKLYTKTFGEDGQAHYYSHANVGAYNLLCNSKYSYDKDETLKWIFYVNYHMHMYNIKTEKSYNKWFNIFGEEKFNNLKLLNQADLFNHTSEVK